MVDLFDEPLRVLAAFKRLPGGSQSTLVQCDDGRTYVVKTHPNPQGTNVLANEIIGTFLLKGLEIESPHYRTVLIIDEDVQKFAPLRRETQTGAYQPIAGLHFGSRYMGSFYHEITETRTPWLRRNAINQNDFNAVYLLDLWAQHHDRRQYFYVMDNRSKQITASFFDNGHLFGGPNWSITSSESNNRTFRGPDLPARETSNLESLIKTLENAVPGLMSEIFPLIPPAWYSGDLGFLERILLFRLSILRDLVDKHYQEYAKTVSAIN